MVPRAYTIVGVVAAALLATIVAAGASTGPLLGAQQQADDEAPLPVVVHRPPTAHGTDHSGFPTWLTVTMTVMLLLYAVGLLVLVILRKRGREDDEERDESSEDDGTESSAWRTVLTVDLGDAVQAQLALIHRGSPRNAIVACWLGLRAGTVRAGLPEVASETSEEYLVSAIRSLGLDPPAITALASLYREARFSEHVMMESQRAEAEQSLRVLADQLAGRRTEQASDSLLEGAAR